MTRSHPQVIICHIPFLHSYVKGEKRTASNTQSYTSTRGTVGLVLTPIFSPFQAEPSVDTLKPPTTMSFTIPRTESPSRDDTNSVSSSDDDLFSLERPSKRAKVSSYLGVDVVAPTTDRKVVLVTGGAGFIGSHTAGKTRA